jgi:hypothetical protein
MEEWGIGLLGNWLIGCIGLEGLGGLDGLEGLE